MGNTQGNNSTIGNDDNRRKRDIQALGERVSFGDIEIQRFYDTYNLFQSHCQRNVTITLQQQQQQQVATAAAAAVGSILSTDNSNGPIVDTNDLSNSATRTSSSSFLYDWYKAILDQSIIYENRNTKLQNELQLQQQQQLQYDSQLRIIQNVIQSILPLNFDNALYRTCFIVPEENHNNNNNSMNQIYTYSRSNNNNNILTSINNNSIDNNNTVPSSTTTTTTTTSIVHMDEYTRTTRLYTFFDALSICNGRRSSKDSITLLFNTVHTLQQIQVQMQQKDDNTSKSSTIPDTQSPPPQSQPQQQESTQKQCISARFLIETGYRLAVSLAYIQVQQEQLFDYLNEMKNNVVDNNDNDNDNNDIDNHTNSKTQQYTIEPYQLNLNNEARTSINAMAMSIVEKKNKRIQRQSLSYATTTTTTTPSSSSTSSLNGSFTIKDDTTDTTTTNSEILDVDDMIELIDVLEWIETVAPMFPYILSTLFNYILFPTLSNMNQIVLGRTTFTIPTILNSLENTNSNNNNTTTPSTTTTVTTDTLLTPTTTSSSDEINLLSVRHFILSCFGTSLNGYYYPIYNSNNDGLSFNRLQNAILGYGGPTIFIIQSVSGGIFGAYTGTAWKESKDFYGNTDSFLYQLLPQTIVYRPKQSGDGTNYMYCNSTARSRGYDQQAHGIGFGGTVSQPRLFISENFDDGCMASSQDMTYENGPLLPPVGTSGHHHSYSCTTSTTSSTNSNGNPSSNNTGNLPIQRHRSLFDIECLEVYGVSNTIDVIEMAIGSRTLNRNTKEELIRKARKVDKAQFLDDFQSGIISSKAFVHRQQIDGRADVDDDCLLKKKEME